MENIDYASIFENFAKQIKDMVEQQIKQAQFDHTFKAVIIEKVSNTKYKILYQNKKYSAMASKDKDYVVGTVVRICAPCNDWSELFII